MVAEFDRLWFVAEGVYRGSIQLSYDGAFVPHGEMGAQYLHYALGRADGVENLGGGG